MLNFTPQSITTTWYFPFVFHRRHIGYDESENNYTDVEDLKDIDLFLYDESDGSDIDYSDEDDENVQQVESDGSYELYY